MEVVGTKGGDHLVLRFEGVFDDSQAREAREILLGLDTGTRVTLDFVQVRELHDLAFALLSQDLLRFQRPGGPIELSVTGLRQHHARILKYLGISGPNPSSEGGADPESDDPEMPGAAPPAAEAR